MTRKRTEHRGFATWHCELRAVGCGWIGMTLETTLGYREVIVGGAIFCAIVGFFVVLSMAAEPWLGSDQYSVTRVIQLALTPVFLLTAVAALLNVFSTRLGRVADRVDLLSVDLQRGASDTEFLSAQLDFLRRRSLILDVAVVLATVGGAATCAAYLLASAAWDD